MAVIAVDIPIQPGLSPLVGNDLPVPVVAELKRKAVTLSVRGANIRLMIIPPRASYPCAALNQSVYNPLLSEQP